MITPPERNEAGIRSERTRPQIKSNPQVEFSSAGTQNARGHWGDIERISNALGFIPVGGHDDRVRMAFAVKSEVGDVGFDLWNEWYRGRGNAYDESEAKTVWKSAGATGPVTIGTLYHEAKQHGWRDDGMHQMPTPEEIAERQRQNAELAAQEDAEIARQRADTARNAAAIWKAASEAKADHPYLSRKHVFPEATLREIDARAAAVILSYTPKSKEEELLGRLLVVPVKQGNKLSTLELIDGRGRKAALAGRGTKTGGYWAAQPLPDGDGDGLTLLIGEGVVTVLSAKEATGHPAIAALSAGNLLTREQKYPVL